MLNTNIPLIPMRYYVKLIELLINRNIPIEDFLKENNIDLNKFLFKNDVNLPITYVEKLIEFCLKFPKNRDLAFDLGNSLHLTSHNLVGYAILTSETLGHALNLMTKYFCLIMPSCRASLVINQDKSLMLTIEPSFLMNQIVTNFHLEAIAVALHKNINELLQSSNFSYHTFLSISEPLYLDKFNQLKGGKFYFNALHKPCLRAIFSHELLIRKLPLADDMTLKTIELKCHQQMKEITHSQDIDEWIHMVLMNSQQLLTLYEIANLLNISSKTLQRNLNKKNIDIRSIRKNVILNKAKYQLKNTQKNITEIAHELGYSSSSNFSRSFKRSTGVTPEQFRFK